MTLFRSLCTPKLNSCLRRRELALLLVFATLNVGCQNGANANLAANQPPANANAKAGYQIVNVFPHDADAYTQGLLFQDGVLLESTGREGQSSLRRVELQTGKVLFQINVPRPYFAEGLALLKGKLYQLTWQHGVGFIYDAASLNIRARAGG